MGLGRLLHLGQHDRADLLWRQRPRLARDVDLRGGRLSGRAAPGARAAKARSPDRGACGVHGGGTERQHSRGWPRIWGNFKAQNRIFSQTSGPACEFWAIPVKFMLEGGTGSLHR